jgi:hypothetical protein
LNANRHARRGTCQESGSSPRAGALSIAFYCCDRGSTQLGVGELPTQQYGGLQVADLAERSGVT